MVRQNQHYIVRFSSNPVILTIQKPDTNAVQYSDESGFQVSGFGWSLYNRTVTYKLGADVVTINYYFKGSYELRQM